MIKLSFLIAIVPIALLLTVSFFVLSALRKIEEKGLKAFGYVVASLLWLAALVIFSGAVFHVAKRCGVMECMSQQKMKICSIPQMRQQDDLPGMAMPEKGALPKDEKRIGMSKCGGNKGLLLK